MKVQKASTHAGSVGVYIAIVERDCATVDEDATSALSESHGGVGIDVAIVECDCGCTTPYNTSSSPIGSLVIVDIAAVERDCATTYVEATSQS